MNKRLLKRHKRQVARAKDKAKISEPDVRTQEQIQADREASRAGSWRKDAQPFFGSASGAPPPTTVEDASKAKD